MNVSAYLHIPFCRSRCGYCDFNTYAGVEHLIEPYLAALQWQFGHAPGLADAGGILVPTVYFGGGTPSLLSPDQVERLLTGLRGAFHVSPLAEITMEANPGTVDLDYLHRIRSTGVNRLSLGVQALDDPSLAAAGRIHTAEQARHCVRLARQAGFENLSLDLIYGLPGQDLAGWESALAGAVDLHPDHLSLYALTLDDETPLGRAVAAGEVVVPDEDAAADMYEAAETMLAGAGFGHYEISNWAIPGHESAHNLVYWRNQPYLGFGAGAHSSLPLPAVAAGWLPNTPLPGDLWARFSSQRRPEEFIAACKMGSAPADETETLSASTSMSETMFLGLRLLEEGVGIAAFSSRFGLDPRDKYGSRLSELAASGLITVDETSICLSRKGRLLGNEVFRRFLD